MTSPDSLSPSQLAQRIDELQGIRQQYPETHQFIHKRIIELEKHLTVKMRNNFNKGVVTPFPPDHVDITSEVVVTPKAPSQVDRELEEWEKSLE